MKTHKTIKHFFLLGCLLLSLNACTTVDTKKVDYLYENGTRSIRLHILNDASYLTYDTPTRVDFEFTNIDPSSAIIGGPGIKMLGNVKGVTQTEFTVIKGQMKKDTLDILVLFKMDEKRIPTSFHVPIRDKN